MNQKKFFDKILSNKKNPISGRDKRVKESFMKKSEMLLEVIYYLKENLFFTEGLKQ